MFERLKASDKLFADETTALDPGRGRTKIGQRFAYARDDRPWGGIDPPGVAYLYAPDCYAGYRALAERNAASLAFCWAHVHRRFYELAQSGPAPIAELYKIESDIRGRLAEERRAARSREAG